jgi:glycosyltransferase involved in cell wall biosynthesis
LNICTIIARNYAAHARVLARSFLKTHPGARFSVLVIDEYESYLDPANEPFEVIRIDEIGLPDVERMAAFYSLLEFSTAVKPWLLRHLLDRDGLDVVVYLDPDIRVEDSLAEIERRAREHGAVLTPHLTAPLPRDGRKPSEAEIMVAGSFNLGFIALGADGAIAEPLLGWWSERLEEECLIDPVNGLFVDQRWIDLAPGMWPGISVLRDPGYNIAYWNLPQRHLEIDGDGYRVDGEPLRFFHFSGYDPRRPDELSRYQNRIALRTDAALSRICDEYGAELLEAGFEEAIAWSYGWSEAADGLKLEQITRSLFRQGVESGRFAENVFAAPGAARFAEYLAAAIYDGGGAPVSRLATAFWKTRPDLRKAYPDIEGKDAAGYLDWIRRFGNETGLSTELLLGGERSKGGDPENEATHAQAPPEPSTEASAGVNLVGYLSSERGVGEAARQVRAALESGDIPTVEVDAPAEPREIQRVLPGLSTAEHPYDFNLLCVNADMLPTIAAALGPQFFAGRTSAGLWFWEVSSFPAQWHAAFRNLDEVWVASEFVAEALRPVAPIPVRTIRVPVAPVNPAEASRAELGMPEGFTFLFVFDYRSVFRRKNPLGLVEAFARAFEVGEGPSLVIKSIFGEQFSRQREQLAEAVASRPDIHLIEDNLSAAEKNAMVTACDCYVSLHRSEGLGLTMAEAMYFGKPVIATAYSGNLDFMTTENSFLVPASLTKIGPDANPYPADGEWADPDLDRAAELMREAFIDPAAAEERGRRAASDIRLTHSPEGAAAWIEARLSEARTTSTIHRLREPASSGSAASAASELSHLLGLGSTPPDEAAGQMRGSAQRARNRVLKPYVDHQHQINETTGRALEEIRAELCDLRATLAEVLELDVNAHGRMAGAEELLRLLASRQERQSERLDEIRDREDR